MSPRPLPRSFPLSILLAATAFCPSGAAQCVGSVVANGDFRAGIVAGSMPFGTASQWSVLTQSPQVVADQGCSAPGCIQMWGNQVVGESIQQTLPGSGFVAGRTYRVELCYRWLDNNNPILPAYVRFRLASSASAPGVYPPGSYDLIGITPNTSSTAWTAHSFLWTAPNNGAFLTINPENDHAVNDGNLVSWGQIDDICITEVTPCPGNVVANGDFSTGMVAGSMPVATAGSWSLITASPQVVTTEGCAAPGCIQMWGNQVVGESVQQFLPGAGLLAGRTYQVSVCYRWLDNANPVLPQYVRFRLCAATATPNNYPQWTYTTIGVTPNTSSIFWNTHTFQWTAPVNAKWLTINPENDHAVNDGNLVSWGQIDDVCIRELPTCFGTKVLNGGFAAGAVDGSMPGGASSGWSALTATPQVVTADGCHDPVAIQMWGNQAVGESIQQQLPGAGIIAGRPYRITVCYRWLDNNNPILPQYVRFRLSTTATAPGVYPPTGAFDLIGVTPNTASTSWSTFTFQWTAPNNASWLMVNPENDSAVNDGNLVSWGQIDNICIQDTSFLAGFTEYGVGCFDLALSLDRPPVLGETIQFTTTNIPAGTFVGAVILSPTKHDPGIDLAPLGMRGCLQYVGLDDTLLFFNNGSTASVPLTLPSSIAFGGVTMVAQAATFSPNTNRLGVVSSNAIDLTGGTH